ncbi:MBOAT family O-acyltransferase [Methylobacterium sp. WL18]|uniref:MBOAT family O-acyltransferase n=1 Tax=Methylobacterium sp. WL18 TaxID=2603897 RepID=UPI0016504629|nr:MBOAT family O-acyltransferase [Methylobacterium sp. WL18]
MLDSISAGLLTLFLGIGYIFIMGASTFSSQTYITTAVCAMVVIFVYLKKFFFLTLIGLPFLYSTVGLSYILFRIIGLIVDLSNGDIERRPDFTAYIVYTCGFTTFLSGPVQSWLSFRDQYEKQPVPITEPEVLQSVSRIATGYFKLAVIGAICEYVFSNLSVQLGAPSGIQPRVTILFQYIMSVATYTGYLYYNFSGYMDIVIGIGGLLQFKLPENFNEPFSSTSFLEFWQRWHMTMSQWFKTYLFTPFMMMMMNRFPQKRYSTAIGLGAFFITFLVMGIWHGSTMVFVIYGTLMAFGACTNKLWQTMIPRYLGKVGYKNLQKKPAYNQICRGLTFAFFSLALTCLWISDIPRLFNLAGLLGVTGFGLSLGVLTLCFVVFSCLWDLRRFLNLNLLSALYAKIYPFATITKCAATVLLVLFVAAVLNKSPEFVYKAF